MLGVNDADDGETWSVAIGEGIEEAVIEDAEDGGGETNAQGQGEDADDGEGGRLSQPSEGVAEVLEEVREEGDVACFTTLFFGVFEAAEFEARAAKGFLAGNTCGDQIAGIGVEVKAKLDVDFVFEARAVKSGTKPGTEATPDSHDSPKGGHGIRRCRCELGGDGSFVPQGHHGVDAYGAAGREIGGEKSDDEEQCRRLDEESRIVGPHAKEQGLDKSSGEPCA